MESRRVCKKNGEMELWLNGELVQTVTGSNASASFDGGVTNQTTTINRYANGFALIIHLMVWHFFAYQEQHHHQTK